MSNKDKDFYVWTMEECIKSTYEWWGTDMMSMYRNIEKDFPNEAIANLIPHHEDLLFDIKTQELSTKYKKLNLCSWNRFAYGSLAVYRRIYFTAYIR